MTGTGGSTRQRRLLLALVAALLPATTLLPMPGASATSLPVAPASEVVRLDGPPGPTAAPMDGRLRGDGYAAAVVGVATGDRTDRTRAPAGQRLWVFGLSATTTAPATGGAPVSLSVTVTAGSLNTPVPFPAAAGSTGGPVGPVWFEVSLPASAPDVVVSIQTSGFTQSFSLAHMARVGSSPAVLYRDATASQIVLQPDTQSVLPESYDQEAPSAPLPPGSGLPVHVVSVAFGYFAPDSADHQAPASDQAWMVVRLRSYYPDYSRGVGGFLEFLQPVTAPAVTLTVPGQAPQTATLVAGGGGDRYTDSTGQLIGAFPDTYLFTASASLTTATLSVAPGPLEAAQYAEGVTGTATPIPPSGAASLPINLPTAQPPAVPPGASATPARLAAGSQPSSAGPSRIGVRTDRVAGSPMPSWLLGAVLVAVVMAAAAVALIVTRRRRRQMALAGASPGISVPPAPPSPPPASPSRPQAPDPSATIPDPTSTVEAPADAPSRTGTRPPPTYRVLVVPPAHPFRLPAGTLLVLVLGPVGIEGWPEGTEPPGQPGMEVLAFLALHPGEQFSGEKLRTVLSATRARALDAGTVPRYVNNLRRALGDERIPEARGSGGYQAIGVTTDAALFAALVDQAQGATPETAARHLADALSLVRGAPFADAPAGAYGWADTDLTASTLAASIYHAASDLAGLGLDAGDPILAGWATGRGLRVWPTDEILHQQALSAAALQGPSALTRAWAETNRLLAAHDEVPSDRLTEHYQRLRDAL